MAGATIIDIVYGIDVNSSEGAGYFKIIEKATTTLSEYMSAGSFLGERSTSTSMLMEHF